MSTLHLRPLGHDDLDVLRDMLMEAAFWRAGTSSPPPDDALAAPSLRPYHAGWGRRGDRGLVAALDASPVGAAWYRRFDRDEHGYGFVDEVIPEITVGVAPDHRQQGLGRALLSTLLVQARLDAVPAVSLSVEDDNPARRLYETLGFRPVSRGGGAVTMVLELTSAPPNRS
jgi:ribosomal protein S18 acetylase RimI-like enzyme